MRKVENILDLGDKKEAQKALEEIIELLEYYENLHPTGRAARWLEKKDAERLLTGW